MCGIGGYLGRFDEGCLASINDSQRHRGPDGEGTWTDESVGVGLCHQRLSIIDLSDLGRQPMTDTGGRAVITYNGEVYNYRELRGEIGHSAQLRSATDTEVVLALYLQHGHQCLGRLNGIFSFAIWDASRKELFLARDPLGVKPLYYAETSAGFIFASELKSILRAVEVDRSINLQGLVSYLAFMYSPSPDTMVKGIRKLPPGWAMKVGLDGRVSQWQYYWLPCNTVEPDMMFEDAVSQLRSELSVAVKRQMVADVPVGAFLSGGLDSSAVVAHARSHCSGRRFQCFTMEMEGAKELDGDDLDLPYAERVADYLGVDLVKAVIGRADIMQRVPDMVYQLDEPQADIAALNSMFISQMAREQGIKVLLAGAGGDDVFTGYRRHWALNLERYWTWMPRQSRMLLKSLSSRVSSAGVMGRRINKAFQYGDMDENDRIASYFLWLHPDITVSCLDKGLLARSDDIDLLARMRSTLADCGDQVLPMNRMLVLDLLYFLTDHNLNYTDKMSMATGVEVRVPLIDLEMVKFAFRLPVSFKQRGRHGKYILRKAMEGILPDSVIYRSKTGFGIPLRQWFSRELKPMLMDVLAPSVLNRRGLFDAEGVQRLLDLNRRGVVDAAYPILAIMCIEFWCQRFLDGR
ncbi:MAG: Asparagine synthetase [glutamine-hydrolyzing] 1 [Verrucomicrobia subdivision 3 bacterium]|nr:Asparagine synthetase [glutamine-hydrolyzing] 1 [Limisphaerales bacterium]MCS1415830.1 Asparagine synthetase [glutamine-hydrolyzing] 1 [Limisphaerales bacterium]